MTDRIIIGIVIAIIWVSGCGQTPENSIHFDSVEPVHYDLENRFIVEKNGKFGLADSNMVTLTPIEFDYISNWETKKLRGHIVIKNEKQGIITRNGVLKIPTEYDEIIIGLNDHIVVKRDAFYGTITRHNEGILPFIYEEILWDSSNRLYVKSQGNYYQIDFEGNILKERVSKEFVDNFRLSFNMEKIWLDPTLNELIIIDVELEDDEILNEKE